jgi:hypothetical protein
MSYKNLLLSRYPELLLYSLRKRLWGCIEKKQAMEGLPDLSSTRRKKTQKEEADLVSM